MAERLPWFTLEVEHWLNELRSVPVIIKGALLELWCWAWAHGQPACTLPDDDEELASLSGLGADGWKLYGARVRKLLRPHEGRLVDPHLYAIYLRQSSRAQTNRQNGKTGAEKRWGKNKPESIGTILGTPPPSERVATAMPNGMANGKANAIANGKANAIPVAIDSPRVSSKILSLEVLETKDFRSDGSESIATAMPDATTAASGETDAADSADVPGDEPPALSEEQRNALSREYYERLSNRYDVWAEANSDDAAALELRERKLLGLEGRTLTPRIQQILRGALFERLRELRGWPTSEEWIALQLAARTATTTTP